MEDRTAEARGSLTRLEQASREAASAMMRTRSGGLSLEDVRFGGLRLQQTIQTLADVAGHLADRVADQGEVRLHQRERGSHLATYQELAGTSNQLSQIRAELLRLGTALGECLPRIDALHDDAAATHSSEIEGTGLYDVDFDFWEEDDGPEHGELVPVTRLSKVRPPSSAGPLDQWFDLAVRHLDEGPSPEGYYRVTVTPVLGRRPHLQTWILRERGLREGTFDHREANDPADLHVVQVVVDEGAVEHYERGRYPSQEEARRLAWHLAELAEGRVSEHDRVVTVHVDRDRWQTLQNDDWPWRRRNEPRWSAEA